MQLNELFDQLQYGELSQMSMGGFDSAIGIAECDYPKIVAHVNLGLIELYKRFTVKSNKVVIQQYSDIQTYILDSKYSINAPAIPGAQQYILDTVEDPFTDDILRITRVKDEANTELFLNDEHEDESVFTPTYKSLLISVPNDTSKTTIHYRATPTKIDAQGLNIFSTEILLPDSLIEPLCLFIASRVFSNLNADGGIAEGNSYLQRFEISCKRIIKENLLNVSNITNEKLDCRGWA